MAKAPAFSKPSIQDLKSLCENYSKLVERFSSEGVLWTNRSFRPQERHCPKGSLGGVIALQASHTCSKGCGNSHARYARNSFSLFAPTNNSAITPPFTIAVVGVAITPKARAVSKSSATFTLNTLENSLCNFSTTGV